MEVYLLPSRPFFFCLYSSLPMIAVELKASLLMLSKQNLLLLPDKVVKLFPFSFEDMGSKDIFLALSSWNWLTWDVLFGTLVPRLRQMDGHQTTYLWYFCFQESGDPFLITRCKNHKKCFHDCFGSRMNVCNEHMVAPAALYWGVESAMTFDNNPVQLCSLHGL